MNPCNARVCDNVNWNVSNYKDLNLNDKCKKVISNYCHINYDKDENCLCWDPKYKNTKKCIEDTNPKLVDVIFSEKRAAALELLQLKGTESVVDLGCI